MTRRILSTISAISVAVAVVVAVLSAASPAHAASAADSGRSVPSGEELAAARRLFGEAKKLEKDGDWQGALDKLETVAKVKLTPQVRFHVALCHEHLGRLVEAINGFELAAQEAEAAHPRAAHVADNAPPRARALRHRVAHLRLRIIGQIHASRVSIDGREISPALLDTALPVDPGTHRVEVRRGGEVTHSEQLSLGEAESGEIELEIHDRKPPPDGGGAGGGTGKPSSPPPPEVPPESAPSRLPAYLLAGAGLAGLGAAAVTFALRQATIANVRCRDPDNFTGCDPADRDTIDLAQTYDLASKISLGVGAAALVTGVVLWFVLAPPDDPPSTKRAARRLVPRPAAVGLAPVSGGLGLVGRF